MTTDPRLVRAIAAEPVDAALERRGDGWLLRIHRDLPVSLRDLWERMTFPEQARTWTPCVPDEQIVAPGPITLREQSDDEPLRENALVVRAPCELIHTWGDGQVHWLMSAADGRSQLTLQHTVPRRDEVPMMAAGWHICLAVLRASIRWEDIERIVGDRALDYGFEVLRDRYAARFEPFTLH